ncbi:glycosyltransferase [Aeromonas caviae]|uniref:glycosyltransferase n=1 Tax=Aeromonas caviae TaxID=648 RepID=UPI0038CFED25
MSGFYNFTLLMSVYKNDNPHHLYDALLSVVNCTLLPHEVVIVEDGEISNLLSETISEFEHKLPIKRIPLERNLGLGKALSIGLLQCSHEWVARFDSDDICHPLRFEKQLDYIKNHGNISIVGSWIAEFQTAPENSHAYRKTPTSHQTIVEYAKSRNPFNHMTVMYRKKAVLSAGNYQDDYLYEDYALWVRMIKHGCVTANIPEFLVYARTGNGMEVRRGGIKYVKSEVKAQYNFYKLGFISLTALFKNLAIRVPVRLVPGSIRKFIYRQILRR